MTERNTINIDEIRFDEKHQMWDVTVKHKDGSCFVSISARNYYEVLKELNNSNVDILNEDGSLCDPELGY